MARGDHALAMTLAAVARPDELASSTSALDHELHTPIVAALREHGSADPELAAEMLQPYLQPGAATPADE